MLLILKKLFLTWLLPEIFRYDSPKKMSHDFVRGQSVAETCFSHWDYREIFIKKYYIVQKLDHMRCSKFKITTSLYKPIKLVKLKFVFSPELHYMPDGLTF